MLLLYQQLALQYAQMVSPMEGEKVAQQILSGIGQQMPTQMGVVDTDVQNTEEHPYVERARRDARASTQAD
jgi:hypothetical protein